MPRSKHVLLILALLILGGCSTTNNVVGKGLVQKRKYRAGWHLSDLRFGGNEHKRATKDAQRTNLARITKRTSTVATDLPEVAPVSASAALLPSLVPGKKDRIGQRVIDPDPGMKVVEETFTVPLANDLTEPSITGPRRWNRMAVVSGVFLLLSGIVIAATGGSSILPYLFTFAFITGIIGLILAIKHNERGKLIAIAAILVPLVITILVIVAINSGF